MKSTGTWLANMTALRTWDVKADVGTVKRCGGIICISGEGFYHRAFWLAVTQYNSTFLMSLLLMLDARLPLTMY